MPHPAFRRALATTDDAQSHRAEAARRRPVPRLALPQVVAALVVLLGAISLAAPAFARLNGVSEQRPAEALLAVLADARQAAIEHHVRVTLVLDPVTGRFRADSSGATGRGVLIDSTVALPSAQTLTAGTPRPTFRFDSTGSAIADSVLVHDGEATLMVLVDPATGVPHVSER